MTDHPPQPHAAAAVEPGAKAGLPPPPAEGAAPLDPTAPLLLALAQRNAHLDAADAAVFVRFTDEKIPLVQRISVIEALRRGRWPAWSPRSCDPEKAEPRALPTQTQRRRPRHDWPVLLTVVCLLLAGAAFVYVDLFGCHATKQ